MCFFSSPKAPEAPPPPPVPAPAPVPTPSEVNSQASDEARRRKLERLRFGLASTIKTGGRGIVGKGPELTGMGAGKTTLGA